MLRDKEKAPALKDYIPIVGESTIDELKLLASHLKGRKIQHINSTKAQGSVAEMLNRVVPLMKELGVDIEWDAIESSPEFFNVTKKFQNAIHGRPEVISDKDFDLYLEAARKYVEKTKIKGDVVFVHDHQPIGLIQNKKRMKNIKICLKD